jgi:threonine dehydratase
MCLGRDMNVAPPTIQDIPNLVLNAHLRIRERIFRTPLRRSSYFSQRTGANVFFKYESFQVSGSFKARGALNKLAMLTETQLKRGVVAASTGNHGVAVALAARSRGIRALVFMPRTAAAVKVDAVRQAGAESRLEFSNSGDTEKFARNFAADYGMTFVSPYNDPAIIAGQGTIGIEIEEQLSPVHEIFVAAGGGGLLSGIAGYLKGKGSSVKIVACSPLIDHALYASTQMGKVVEFKGQPTLADGCAGGLEDHAITLPLARELADEWALVPEMEIREAMRLFIEHENQLLEGSAGLAIAALLKAAHRSPSTYCDRNVVILICGSRLSIEMLRSVLS